MRLRTFIFILFGGIIGAVMLLFYFRTSTVLKNGFTHMEELHRESVSHFARTILEAKTYSLNSFSEILGNSPELSKDFLLASNQSSKRKLVSELVRIKKQMQLDIIDIIHITKRTPLIYPEFRSKPYLRLSKKNDTKIHLDTIDGKLALVSVSPFRVYQDIAGILVLGYYLNDSIGTQIAQATNAKTSFVLQAETIPQGNLVKIPLENNSNTQLSIPLLIEGNFIKGANKQIRYNIILLGILCFILATVLLYLFLEFGFVRYFTQMLKSINKGADQLDQGVVIPPQIEVNSPIFEVKSLSSAFKKYSESLLAFQARIQSKSRTEAMGEMASQVAHDLASPLTALEFSLDASTLKSLPETNRTIIRSTLNRIREIIKSLSSQSKENSFSIGEEEAVTFEDSNSVGITSEPLSIEMISSICVSIIDEKKSQYSNYPELQLQSIVSGSNYDLFSKVQPNEFKRVLSNLINNSVESLPERQGEIKLEYRSRGNSIRVSVFDNGTGIPKDVLPSVFKRGLSHGKKSGSGLGLWHAKELVESWGGTIDIETNLNAGTGVHINLPKSDPPKWFVRSISIQPNKEYVILDDDSFIHQMWEQRILEGAGGTMSPKILHFYEADDFRKWVENTHKNSHQRLYLCDYELQEKSTTGLDLIEQLNIQEQSILVTGFDETAKIRHDCELRGVRLIPKSLASQIPIYKVETQPN